MPSRSADARAKALVAPIADVIQAGTSNPKADAALERAGSSFDPSGLAAHMQGGAHVLARKCVVQGSVAGTGWGWEGCHATI